jgi:F-type H+-transporting ATPase subunit b
MNVRVFGWIAAIGLMSGLTTGSTDATVSYAQQTAAPTTEAKDTAVPKPAADAEQPVTPEKPEKPAKPEKQTTGEPAKGEHAGGDHAAGDHAAGDHAAGDHAAGDHAAGGHGHHDPTDLSHANDGPGHTNAFPKALTGLQEIKADLAIYTFVVFLLLLGILLKFGWGPIMAGLDKREKSIRDLIATSERNARESEELLKQNQVKLAAAAESARELLQQARREAEQAREMIVSEARASAQREKERALEDIAAAKTVALREIAQSSVNTSITLATRILQREVSAADHANLIQEALGRFPSRN